MARLPPPPSCSVARASVVFLGMAGRFSARVFEELLAAAIPVNAVLLPASLADAAGPIAVRARPLASLRALPVHDAAPSIDELAWRSDVPVYAVRSLASPVTHATITAHAPDVLCVACFPRRLPASLLACAWVGGLNVHPSLLPTGRGPAPRFWAFRHGLDRSGVTVHVMTAQLDAGPIADQASFDLPIGMTGADFDDRAGRLGGQLLADALDRRVTADGHPITQDERHATYDPNPSTADYVVPIDGPARAAYRFVAGVAGDGGPLRLDLGDRQVGVHAAISYADSGDLGQPWVWRDDVIWVQCRPGLLALRAVVSDAIPPPNAATMTLVGRR